MEKTTFHRIAPVLTALVEDTIFKGLQVGYDAVKEEKRPLGLILWDNSFLILFSKKKRLATDKEN